MENVLLQWDWGGSKGSNPSIGLLNWLSWFLTISCRKYNDTSHRRYRKWCSSFWSWCRRLKISSSILLVSSSNLLLWLRSWTKAFLKESQVWSLGTHLLETRKSDWQDSVHSAFERSTTVMLGIRTTSWPQSNRPYSDLFLRPEFRCIWNHQMNCWPSRHLCSWFSGYKALRPCCVSGDWTLQKVWFWFSFESAKVRLMWYYHLMLVEKSPQASETPLKAWSKKTPANRGHFIACGCYLTTEVLFAVATLHQLAIFLHFPDEAAAWASPHNSGLKSTERVISELQGKTTEL